MPRNAQGLYTLPAGNPVISGTEIESVWANTTMDDLAAAITGSLPRDGSAPMTGPLTLNGAAPTAPRHAVSKAYLEQFLAYATGMPVGAVFAFAAASVPTGYLLCNGQAVSRTTYSVLFGVIGTTYGPGDGASTFNVPDLRGEFVRGRPDDRGIGSKQVGSFAAHTHPVSDPGHTHGASQAAHSHAITTGSHNHSINDPGHSHSKGFDITGGFGVNAATAGSPWQTNTGGAATGISINGVGNLGGSADSQQPAVIVASATTGETIGSTGGTETRPQNIALDYYIKAIDDGSQVVSITGISSSDDNMISVSNTNVVVPELVIHSNVAFGIPKLDAGGKILLSQLPQGASVLLGYFDASSGQNPSQAFPSTNYSNGEEYIVSVGGTIQVRNPATSIESNTTVVVGGTLLYLEGQTQPDGWYYSIPVSADNASNISFLPEGTVSATNVQAAIAELDGETQAALATKAPTSAGSAVGTSFTPTGSISSTDVQSAILEVVAETASLSNAPPVMNGAVTPGVATSASRDDHVHPTDTSRAPTSAMTAVGTSFTPSGTIAATNVQAAIAELNVDIQASGIPSGAVMDFAMNAAPTGWLACNGALVSRATYAALFAAIGTAWGAGDGSTTFQLPDMRGYFRRGVGTNADGTAAGAFAAKQTQAFLAHAHPVNDPTHAHVVNDVGHNHGISADMGNGGGGGGVMTADAITTENPSARIRGVAAATGINLQANGTGISIASVGGTETRPANIAVLTCIKT